MSAPIRSISQSTCLSVPVAAIALASGAQIVPMRMPSFSAITGPAVIVSLGIWREGRLRI